MALSGKVTTGEYSNRSVTLNWSATQDIANNRSTTFNTEVDVDPHSASAGSYSGQVYFSIMCE
jgi:hypothetical protein